MRARRQISTSVSTSLAYDNRVRNQVTGIFLNGFLGEPVVTGGEHPVNDQVIVDRAVQRANGSIYPTDTIAENVTMTSASGPSLFVSDPALGLGPVAIPVPAPVVS
jgi:hypothetical protein